MRKSKCTQKPVRSSLTSSRKRVWRASGWIGLAGALTWILGSWLFAMSSSPVPAPAVFFEVLEKLLFRNK